MLNDDELPNPSYPAFGLWKPLGLLDELLNGALDEVASSSHTEMVRAYEERIAEFLARLRYEEFFIMRRSLELIIVAGEDVRIVLGRSDGMMIEFSSEQQSEARQEARRIIEEVEARGSERIIPPRVGEQREADLRWMVRRVLDLVEAMIVTSRLSEEEARDFMVKRFREHRPEEVSRLQQTVDMVILAAATVLSDVDDLIDKAEGSPDAGGPSQG